MIPPKLPIKISGEAGKRLGPQRISLELIQATGSKGVYHSLATDTVTWLQREGAIVPEEDEQVCLWDADGRRIFVGRAKSKYTYGAGWNVTVSGPFEFMDKAKVLAPNTDPSGATAIRALKTFPKGDLTLSVRELLQMAVDQGAEFRIGNISQAFAVSQMTFKEQYYAATFGDMLKWMADVATRVRYDTDGLPLLDVIRRGDAETVLVELGSGLNRCTAISMESRPDLVPSSVEVQYVEREPVTYKPRFVSEIAGTPAGPSYKRQTITVSGPENDTFLPGESYPSVNVQTINAGSGSNAILAWMKNADSFIASLYERYGPQWFGPFAALAGYSQFFVGSAETLQWATTPGGVLSGSKVTRAPRMVDKDGNPLTGWHAVISPDGIPDWFTSLLGIQTRPGTFYCDAVVSMEWPGDEPQPIDDYPGVGEFSPRSYWTHQNGFYGTMHRSYFIMEVALPVTFIDVEFLTLTQIWKPAEYQFLEPPRGLAENLFRAQQWLPYEGQATFGPGAAAIPGPGELLSVNGAIPEWRTAGAMIASTTMDFTNGSANAKIGFPSRMSSKNLLSRFKVNASDNIEQGAT